MSLIRPEDAVKILERLVYKHRDNLKNIDVFLRHSHDTGEKARKLAVKLDLNSDEACLEGLFHDVGRPLTEDKDNHTFHEIIGARYMEREGVRLGITDSQEQCDRIAQAFRSHFVVYNQFEMPEFAKWSPGLRDTNRSLLLPSSWPEAIIVYSDLTNDKGEDISFEDRIADIKDRDAKANSPRLLAVRQAEVRLYKLKDQVERALSEGKLPGEYQV